MAGLLSGLSISSTNIRNCDDIATHLKNVGIECKVINQNTVRQNEMCETYVIEKGCDILITDPEINKQKIKDIWLPLHKKYNLKCGYLNLLGSYRGCVWDYLRDSNCPRGGSFCG